MNYLFSKLPFPLFRQCFQKACFPGASKGVIVWEWVKLAFGELNNFQDEFYKISTVNECQIFFFFYHITDFSELN